MYIILVLRLDTSGALLPIIAPPVFVHPTYMALLYAVRNSNGLRNKKISKMKDILL